MIGRDDILDALTKSTAYDSQHTPTPSRILIDAWLEHFERYAPGVERDELILAVAEYHREPRDRMLQPADLSAIARVLRRDALDRADPEDRPQRNVAGELPDYPEEWDSEQRLTAYWYAVSTRSYPAITYNWHSILDAATRKHEARESV